jgi:IS5 family transposase
MTKISRFTERCVVIAQRVTGDGDESAAPDGGGGFADYALVSLHCLRIYLDSSYRMTIDLLKEMPQITGEIGLDVADLPAPSTLCKALDHIEMSLCRVLLRQSSQLHDPSEHAALDATSYERDRASRHYCHRTNYCVQTLKVTKLVDTESQTVLDVHCSTTLEGSDADLCGPSLLTRATTRTLSANGCVSSGFARSSSTASAHRTTTPITLELTEISMDSGR